MLPTCVPQSVSSPVCAPFHEPGRRSPFRHRPEAIHASCISTTCWLNESTAYCSRASAGVRLARKDRRKNSSTPSLNGNGGIAPGVVPASPSRSPWLLGVAIDKDVVRRILCVHYRPESHSGGPSRLTFLGHMKDSLWSMDLFRCESASLRTHWVLVVMDQYSRRIIGFGVHAGTVDGVALCRMFNRAIRWQLEMPKYLRVLEVTEIKKVPYVPLSHPLVERLIGTLRRECLDRRLFWTATDLEAKLLDFEHYYNEHRTHAGRQGHPPVTGVNAGHSLANLSCCRWQKHCRGLYQTPMAV